MTTASIGGANASSKSDWTPLQAFKTVYLSPDCDEPGETYVRDVVGILASLPGSREVLIARLPGLAEHEDAVDWLQGRVPAWDGYGPIPREPGDDLDVELRAAIEAAAVPAPPEWAQPAPTTAAEPEPWETPMPLDAAQHPVWPRNVFPPAVQAFVDALSVAHETPSELAASIVLAVLATAVQRRYCVMPKPGYFQPVNIWTAGIMPPASRKSRVFTDTIKPLADWQAAEWSRLEPEITRKQSQRKTLEQRIEHCRSRAAKAKLEEVQDIMQEIEAIERELPEVPTKPRLWTDDCTPEHIATLLAENGECLSVLSSEGGVFQILGGRYAKNNGPNLQVFLQAHEGDSHVVDRATRPGVFLSHPALTVGLMIQPDVLHSLTLTPEFRGRGLLGRFLYVLPKSNVGHRQLNGVPVPEHVAEAYAAVVLAILGHPQDLDKDGKPCCHVLTVSSEARDDWQAFSLQTEASMAPGATFENLKDWAGKLPAAVARIAAVLHVARHAYNSPWDMPVGAGDMAAAIRMAEALSKHALIAFDAMGTDPAVEGARAIRDWICREGKQMFTHREAHKAHQSRFHRAKEIDAPLDILIERGYIRPCPRATTPIGGGRPSMRYEVNPIVLGGRQ